MSKLITCRKCGLVDSFYIIEKANHQMAYCSRCRAFIKHIPHSDPKFYFGKYKGHLVAAIEDLKYLEWALANIKMAEAMRDAVRERINTLHELSR